jgi:hypothetical protein
VSAELDSLIAALAAAESEGADDGEAEAILAHMERAATMPGGLERLTERFATSRVAILNRALTFVLARAASHDPAPDRVSPLVWATAAAVTSDDDWTRVNLLSAMQLLADRGALPADAPAGLSEFLVDALERGPEVVAAAAPALLALDAGGLLAGVDRAALLARLDSLPAHEDDLTQGDIEALRPRLVGN